MPDNPKPMPEGWLSVAERALPQRPVIKVRKLLAHATAADQRIADLEKAIRAKLKDCRENGDCSDAALILDECCSNECAALAEALGGGAEEGKS